MSARRRRQSGDDLYGANLQYNAANWGVGIGYNHNYVVPCNTSPVSRERQPAEALRSGNVQRGRLRRLRAGQAVRAVREARRTRTPSCSRPTSRTSSFTAESAASPLSWAALQINSFDMDTMRGLAGPTDSDAYHFGIVVALRQQHPVRHLQLRQGRWTVGLGHGRTPRPATMASRTSMTSRAVPSFMRRLLSWTTATRRV